MQVDSEILFTNKGPVMVKESNNLKIDCVEVYILR